MSSDEKFLKVLAAKTLCELKFFEQVSFQRDYLRVPIEAPKRVFLCVGRHALFFVRANLSRVCKDGMVEYKALDKVIEDTSSRTTFVLAIKTPVSTETPSQIKVVSEGRAALIAHISVCYLTDRMCRECSIAAFPRYELNLETPEEKRILPFVDYKHVAFKDYGFFLRVPFEDVPSPTAKTNTGSYMAAASIIKGVKNVSAVKDLVVDVHIYDPVPHERLGQINREHIRWLALEYRQALVQEQQTYLIRNQLYLKKMNLSNDPASWVGWEMLLKGETRTTMCIVLRRQYIPPLCDSVQDIAILMSCPTEKIDKDKVLHEEDLRHECHLAADSFGPLVQNMTLYPDVIQVKLDALLFDEEGYAWCSSRMSLRPRGELKIELHAVLFVRGILKILLEQNVLPHPQLVDEATRRAAEVVDSTKGQMDVDADPMWIAMHTLQARKPGLATTREVATNAWLSRVATYMAYCVDGGVLPGKFSLADIVNTLMQGGLADDAYSKLTTILSFLLHVRDEDFTKPWEAKPLSSQFQSICVMKSTFNDKVLQVLLELNFVRQVVCKHGGGQQVTRAGTNGEEHNRPVGAMNNDYAELLCQLLQTNASSVNVKASICRQIIREKDTEHGPTLCLGLMFLMRDGGLFLATYACAALVNLSQANQVVKNSIMRNGGAQIFVRSLRSKDDDLVLYTLMLLVHLTKLVHHRMLLANAGLIPILIEILTASYGAVRYKRRIVVEVCGVLGQMCNDEETRKLVCESYQVLDMLVHIFDEEDKEQFGDQRFDENADARQPQLPAGAARQSHQLLSKVMFALKQLCANSEEHKETVGKKVTKLIVKALSHEENLQHLDWAVNALLLLLLLSINTKCCEAISNCGWDQCLSTLNLSELSTMDATRDRLKALDDRVREVANAAQAAGMA
mmetsp:Transcript_112970/g.319507  ORF Transcript_112970/g.319507 Transcript_112970/m.319507 type:complete len:908 (+) Transcript_112970:125-2848(+)